MQQNCIHVFFNTITVKIITFGSVLTKIVGFGFRLAPHYSRRQHATSGKLGVVLNSRRQLIPAGRINNHSVGKGGRFRRREDAASASLVP